MNKYETIETIGEGQYGVVLKAINKETSELGELIIIQLQLKNLKKMILSHKISVLFSVKLKY